MTGRQMPTPFTSGGAQVLGLIINDLPTDSADEAEILMLGPWEHITGDCPVHLQGYLNELVFRLTGVILTNGGFRQCAEDRRPSGVADLQNSISLLLLISTPCIVGWSMNNVFPSAWFWTR